MRAILALRKLFVRRTSYDAHCESSQGWYTVEVILASGFETELTKHIIQPSARRPDRVGGLGWVGSGGRDRQKVS